MCRLRSWLIDCTELVVLGGHLRRYNRITMYDDDRKRDYRYVEWLCRQWTLHAEICRRVSISIPVSHWMTAPKDTA